MKRNHILYNCFLLFISIDGIFINDQNPMFIVWRSSCLVSACQGIMSSGENSFVNFQSIFTNVVSNFFLSSEM